MALVEATLRNEHAEFFKVNKNVFPSLELNSSYISSEFSYLVVPPRRNQAWHSCGAFGRNEPPSEFAARSF